MKWILCRSFLKVTTMCNWRCESLFPWYINCMHNLLFYLHLSFLLISIWVSYLIVTYKSFWVLSISEANRDMIRKHTEAIAVEMEGGGENHNNSNYWWAKHFCTWRKCFEKHCSRIVSAGPWNSMYHLACQICRNCILHNNSDFVFGWGRKFFHWWRWLNTSSG